MTTFIDIRYDLTIDIDKVDYIEHCIRQGEDALFKASVFHMASGHEVIIGQEEFEKIKHLIMPPTPDEERLAQWKRWAAADKEREAAATVTGFEIVKQAGDVHRIPHPIRTPGPVNHWLVTFDQLLADYQNAAAGQDAFKVYQSLLNHVGYSDTPAVTQIPTLTIIEQVTLMTLLHAHLNADQPRDARKAIAHAIVDFVEGKDRSRFVHMGMTTVLKEFGAAAFPHTIPDDVVTAWHKCQTARRDNEFDFMADSDDNLVIVLGRHISKAVTGGTQSMEASDGTD